MTLRYNGRLLVYQGKGKKDRIVVISGQLLIRLRIFRKKNHSDDFVFKTHGRGVGLEAGWTDVAFGIISRVANIVNSSFPLLR